MLKLAAATLGHSQFAVIVAFPAGAVRPSELLASAQAWLSSKGATGVSLAVDIFARTNHGSQFVCGK